MSRLVAWENTGLTGKEGSLDGYFGRGVCRIKMPYPLCVAWRTRRVILQSATPVLPAQSLCTLLHVLYIYAFYGEETHEV
jgi:hypothetical protein